MHAVPASLVFVFVKETSMCTSAPSYHLFVGIDIAAKSFTVVTATGSAPAERSFTLDQTPQGFTTLQERFMATGIAPANTLIVLEATSTYWIALAVTLHQAGYHVSVANPEHVHHYAKSLPRRGKTDQLDAGFTCLPAMPLSVCRRWDTSTRCLS